MEQIAMKRAKVVVEKNNSDDHISSLPEPILHQIISLLPPRYATATSILSHRWETIWLSFPCIDIDESDFSNREKLYSCLKSTSVRHNLSNLQTLRLRFNLYCSPQLNHCVCEFMNTVSRDCKILKELDIRLMKDLSSREHDIVVPEIICICPKESFSSFFNLIFLRVEGCRFEGCAGVDLPNLKTLHLKNMFIHEEFLVEFIHAFPGIETLAVEYCYGIRNFRICHSKIKNLVLGFRNNLETLELNVPGVKCINFLARANSVAKHWLSEVLECQNFEKILAQNLETLYLERLVLEPDVLQNLISIFPEIKRLVMKICDVLGRPQLHSITLTSLEMKECKMLDEVDIRAPNLQIVKYVHNPEGVQFNHKALMFVRRLSLDSIDVEHGTLWIISNFPVIVSLKLAFCGNMKQLRIASNTLESLDVCGCEDLKYCMIVAPQLLRFTYSGEVVHVAHLVASRKLRVMLNLEDANSRHEHVGFVNKFVGFVQKVGTSAASMTIEMGYSCNECLMMIKDVHVPLTCLVQHLKFDSWPDAMGLLDLVSCLLGISIYCNNLSINRGWFSLTLKFQEIKERGACVRKTNLARIEDHLVRVEMKCFEGTAEQMVLVELLAGKAKQMQQMSIWMKRGKQDDPTQKCLDACNRSKLHPFNIVSRDGYVSFSRNAI